MTGGNNQDNKQQQPWVLLESERGQQMLAEAEDNGTSQFNELWPHFHKQIGYCYCGYAAAACILSALQITDRTVRDCDLLQDRSLSKCVYESERIEGRGIPLYLLSRVIDHYGANTTTYHMQEPNLDTLRNQVILTCNCSGSRLSHNKQQQQQPQAMLLNYWVPKLHMCCIESGHHSVAAAYHQTLDMILVLDPSQFMKHAWYRASDMCAAMNTIDRSVDSYRGFIICSK